MNKQDLISNFAINLERQRIELDLSQEEMAKELELSNGAYRRLINGETQKIDVFTLVKLYELTGKFAFEFLGFDDRKLKIVSKLNDLSDQQLMFVHSAVELERLFKTEHPTDYDDYVTLYIPTGSFKDGMIYDATHVDKVNVSAYRNKFGNHIHYALKITSNHLTPVYHKGDILLISKTTIENGDTGLFLNKEDERLYIRKYVNGSPVILEPLNNVGIPFEVNEDVPEEVNKWVKFGKVLTKVR